MAVTISDFGSIEGSNKSAEIFANFGGTLTFRYQMYSIKDSIEIRVGGKTVFDSGFVSGGRSGQIEVPIGAGNSLQVIIATDTEGTAWNYDVKFSERPCAIDTSLYEYDLNRYLELRNEFATSKAALDNIGGLKADLAEIKGLITEADRAQDLVVGRAVVDGLLTAPLSPLAAGLVAIGSGIIGIASDLYEAGSLGVSNAVSVAQGAASIGGQVKSGSATSSLNSKIGVMNSLVSIGITAFDVAQWKSAVSGLRTAAAKIQYQINQAESFASRVDSVYAELVRMYNDLLEKYHLLNDECLLPPEGAATSGFTVQGTRGEGAVTSAQAVTAVSAAPLGLLSVDDAFSNGKVTFGTDGADVIALESDLVPTAAVVGLYAGTTITPTNPEGEVYFRQALGDIDGDGVDDFSIYSYFYQPDPYIYQAQEYIVLSSSGLLGGGGEIAEASLAEREGVYQVQATPGAYSGSPMVTPLTFGGTQNTVAYQTYHSPSFSTPVVPGVTGNVLSLYLDLSAAYATADAADGTTDGVVDNLTLLGLTDYALVLNTNLQNQKSVADLNGNGIAETLFSGYNGEVRVLFDNALSALDAADGSADGVGFIDIIGAGTGLKFQLPDSYIAYAGIPAPLTFGDINGDGYVDIIAAAAPSGVVDPTDFGGDELRVYLGTSSEFDVWDTEDGTADGLVDLRTRTADFTIVANYIYSGSTMDASRDLTGDGVVDLLLNDESDITSMLLVGGTMLFAGLDAADGIADDRFQLGRAVAGTAFRFSEPVGIVADRDGDGLSELAFSQTSDTSDDSFDFLEVRATLSSLSAWDSADGNTDGQIDVAGGGAEEVFRLTIELGDLNSFVEVGDVDGDGGRDFVIRRHATEDRSGSLTFLPTAADLLADAVAETVTNTVTPGLGNDTVTGTNATEMILAGEGDDVIDGAGGIDIVGLPDLSTDYLVDTDDGTTTATHLTAGTVTTVTNVEYLQFSDGFLLPLSADPDGAYLSLLGVELGENGAGDGVPWVVSTPLLTAGTIEYRFVPVSGSAADISDSVQTATIAAGTYSGFLPVPILDDVDAEAPETFTLEVLSLTGLSRFELPDGEVDTFDDLSVTVTLLDDDGGIPDLVLTATVPDPDTPFGSPVSYTFSIENTGNGAATEVEINATLGAFSVPTVTIDVGTLAAGETRTFTVDGTFDLATTSFLAAEVDYAERRLGGPVLVTQTTGAIGRTPDPADLAAQLDVINITAADGVVALFGGVINNGPGRAAGITGTLIADTAVTFNDPQTEQGYFDQSTGVWEVGTMRDQLRRDVYTTVSVADGTSTTLTLAVQSAEPDPDDLNNTDSLFLAAGDATSNLLEGRDSGNVLFGRGGNDTLTGGFGADYLFGDDGRDRLLGGAGDDFLMGGTGYDTMFPGLGSDTIDGEEDRARVSHFDAARTEGVIVSITGVDSFLTAAYGTVTGENGEVDAVGNVSSWSGSQHADVFDLSALEQFHYVDILLTEGDILIDGTNSFKVIYARFDGAPANFDLGGSSVAQLFTSSRGREFLNSETGEIEWEARSSGISIDFGTGTIHDDGFGGSGLISNVTYLDASPLADTIVGGDLVGGENGLTVDLGDGSDSFTGGSGNVTVHGDSGNDTIIGGTASDLLTGGHGNDSIIGGSGNDILWGDEEADYGTLVELLGLNSTSASTAAISSIYDVFVLDRARFEIEDQTGITGSTEDLAPQITQMADRGWESETSVELINLENDSIPTIMPTWSVDGMSAREFAALAQFNTGQEPDTYLL